MLVTVCALANTLLVKECCVLHPIVNKHTMKHTSILLQFVTIKTIDTKLLVFFPRSFDKKNINAYFLHCFPSEVNEEKHTMKTSFYLCILLYGISDLLLYEGLKKSSWAVSK